MPQKQDNGIRLERDMYAPVKAYLEAQGWDARGEVAGCDIAAMRDGRLLMAEMKLTLNLDVILQGVGRQRMADIVYLAVPRKNAAMRTQRWRDTLELLKRLNLGLIVVSNANGRPAAEELIEPALPDGSPARGRAVHRRLNAIRELKGRTGDWNTGGVHRQKLVTAYREAALRLAARLAENGPMSAKQMKTDEMAAERIWNILNDNHYDWFCRVGKGVYHLTDAGRAALATYHEIVGGNAPEQDDAEIFAGTVEDG